MKETYEDILYLSKRKRLRKTSLFFFLINFLIIIFIIVLLLGINSNKRTKILEKYDFSLKREDLDNILNFELVDFWTQSIDFPFKPEDPESNYLKGFVFKRNHFDNKKFKALL